MTLRVVFMGTPDFATPTLTAITEAGHDIRAVYTRAPAASGRGLTARPSSVHRLAETRGWAVRTPRTLRGGSDAADIASDAVDVAVVVAYGLLLPADVLAAPRFGCLNLHASLLPRWRGAAPIHRAVMAGDAETGIAVMRMEEGLDTGPVAMTERVAIEPNATTGDLHDRLALRGAALMVRALAALDAGTLQAEPQACEGVTYAAKIVNEEARIDWNRPARRVHDQIRGLSPWPGAFVEVDLGKGVERVKILRTDEAEGSEPAGTLLEGGLVACQEGAVRPILLQRSGRGPVPAEDFWRGLRLEAGFRFG